MEMIERVRRWFKKVEVVESREYILWTTKKLGEGYASGWYGWSRDLILTYPEAVEKKKMIEENFLEVEIVNIQNEEGGNGMLEGYMSVDEFKELVEYIDRYHSFSMMRGKAVKYISPTYDTRTGEIFHVNLRRGGEGKDFAIVNENKDKNLKEWLYDWLENGKWDD